MRKNKVYKFDPETGALLSVRTVDKQDKDTVDKQDKDIVEVLDSPYGDTIKISKADTVEVLDAYGDFVRISKDYHESLMWDARERQYRDEIREIRIKYGY
jgi:hypothetical protein